MALEDVLDEARWPRPEGLLIRRGPPGEELTIEVVQRGGIKALEATVGASAMLSAIATHWLAAAAIGVGVATALVIRRLGRRRGEVLLSVRGEQLRLGGWGIIELAAITAIESAGTIHGELQIRNGKHLEGRLHAKRVYVEFLARWLNTLRVEAEQARAIRQRYWLPP